jgi:membrane protease YdiL (CAAX protease family)
VSPYDAGQTGIPAFLTLTFGATALLLAPGALSLLGALPGPPERFAVPAVLATFAPILATLLVARSEEGGVRSILRRQVPTHVGVGWHLLALAIFPAIYLAGVGVFALLGGSGATWLYPPRSAQDIAAMIVVPLAEEPAWRGFALPRMQGRYGALKGSVVLGVLWAVYLACKAVVLGGMVPHEPGVSWSALAVSVANVTAASVVFAWLYLRTRGSLAVAVAAHVGLYLDNPYHALPGNLTPLGISTVAIAIAGGALVVIDRRTWFVREAGPTRA